LESNARQFADTNGAIVDSDHVDLPTFSKGPAADPRLVVRARRRHPAGRGAGDAQADV